jgi:hypothetical protein
MGHTTDGKRTAMAGSSLRFMYSRKNVHKSYSAGNQQRATGFILLTFNSHRIGEAPIKKQLPKIPETHAHC